MIVSGFVLCLQGHELPMVNYFHKTCLVHRPELFVVFFLYFVDRGALYFLSNKNSCGCKQRCDLEEDKVGMNIKREMGLWE